MGNTAAASKKDGNSAVQAYLTQAKEEFHRKWEASAKSGNTKLDDFKRLRTLGTGSFGRVMLVQHKESNNYFAMKVLDKAKLAHQQAKC